MNSDMSIRTIASSVSNRKMCKRLGQLGLADARSGRGTGTTRLAGADRTSRRASDGSRSRRQLQLRPGRRRARCTTTPWRAALSFSPSSILLTGMPVHLETISRRLLLRSRCCAASVVSADSAAARPARAAFRVRECARTAAPTCAPDRWRDARGLELQFRTLELFLDVRRLPALQAFSAFQTSSRSRIRARAPSSRLEFIRRFTRRVV